MQKFRFLQKQTAILNKIPEEIWDAGSPDQPNLPAIPSDIPCANLSEPTCQSEPILVNCLKKKKIKNWVLVNPGVPKKAVNSLLKILNEEPNVPKLPNTVASLLEIPHKRTDVISMMSKKKWGILLI